MISMGKLYLYNFIYQYICMYVGYVAHMLGLIIDMLVV